MAKLFISYRRVTWAFTHRLAERLEQLLDAQIFVDFKGVDESNFEHAILRNLRESDAFLLIVTPETFDPQRINRADDWVRREIREALTQEKPIALALYEGTAPPPDEKLPEDIRDITKRQGAPF
ncbi:MAG: toll/interleukin-1 receptor domain-containing protein, partial [Anaerolineae bacterium]|nr:toll/interleukin-1 receptor domain-containing protein [Anaerolineae bacterium]